MQESEEVYDGVDVDEHPVSSFWCFDLFFFFFFCGCFFTFCLFTVIHLLFSCVKLIAFQTKLFSIV